MKELDRVYAAGQTARKQMLAKGQPMDAANCDKTFVALGEDHNYPSYDGSNETPKAFWELRQLYFRNGCLDLPKPSASSTPMTATPTTTTAGASTTATVVPSTITGGSPSVPRSSTTS